MFKDGFAAYAALLKTKPETEGVELAVTDNTQLFEKYRDTRDISVRNELVLNYMAVVKYAAMSLRNVYAKYGDPDDVVNEGVIALINAVETFDLERGVKFETYATLKVRGSIIDFVRKQDFIPRQVRKFGKELDDAYNVLYTELGRHPTNAELAEYLGVTKEKLAKAMATVASAATLSFEELLYEDNFSDAFSGGDEPDRNLYEEEARKVLAEAIATLKENERQVISLYYYEKLKFNDIAKVLGVTESRICQIHTKSMMLLKRKLADYFNTR
ncbi:MAG: FliA/WhiG family RNA polymerase sigma factor [Oscillospiraceae bacterium]|jgi:RNA polymerase sigma factor for flagellar operon FliA|nr:FliA/WhiG family RNA polymerase sigma factor [Oscillospiraceae bacterium]